MWKCFGLSEQEVQKALEDAKDRFHKSTKQATNLTPEQCDKALSDAANILDQVKKKGHGTLKKDHVLRGETEDACSKLKELQTLRDNKVQVTLKFAEEWRGGLFTNNASRSRIGLNIPDRILPQPSDVGSLRSIGNTSISSNDSWGIPSHDQIHEAANASWSGGMGGMGGMGAHDKEQSASSSSGSSRSDLSAPCIIQPANDSGVPDLRQSTNATPSSSEGILSVTTPEQSDNHETSTGVNSIALPRAEHPAEDLNAGTQRIFTNNFRPAVIDFKPPRTGGRLNSIPQLVYCLGLLQANLPQDDDILDPMFRQWLKDTMANRNEQKRLKVIATDVVRAFKRDEVKDADVVSEVVYLAPVLEKNVFRDLFIEFCNGLNRSGLLDFHQMDGITQLIQYAGTKYLDTGDFAMILQLLSTRLGNSHQQSQKEIYYLIAAVARVLDAMVDTNFTGMNLTLHESLSMYLDSLNENSDPYLVYQAAYALQALQCVPENKSRWQETLRRTRKTIQGVSGLVGAVTGLGANDPRSSIALKEGLGTTTQSVWYSALRGADMLVGEGQFTSLKKLVYETPCRMDPEFQWGVCQRLGEIAANPSWVPDIRGSAIAFLGEIYRNNAEWGQQTSIKQWILIILMKLSRLPGNEMHAKALLEDLKMDGDGEKQDLYRASMDIDPSTYPLKLTPSIPTSSILLSRVQGVQESRKRILTEDSAVYSCAYSPDGKLFAVGLSNHKISVYETSNWEGIWTLRGHTGAVFGVAFSPTSSLIASASHDMTVNLWDAETGSLTRTLTGHTDEVNGVAYSPRGNQVASCSDDMTVRIWDADTGSCLQTLSDRIYRIMSVAYSPDGKQIASSGFDHEVRLWDIDMGCCVRILQGHDGPVLGVAYSPHGNLIASAGDDKTVRVWDVDTGMRLLILDEYYIATSVAFSPKINVLACGGVDNTVKLWATELDTSRTLTGHSGSVRSVVYSPSGNQLASGSEDRTVRLWDV
ncbi:MAG: hypothetical protein J3Q66DRAFT_437731 [Benniella sp.]|nr:MAG: hypothetical protein J3Q66DRAFT_437731 [Benniella sp.]